MIVFKSYACPPRAARLQDEKLGPILAKLLPALIASQHLATPNKPLRDKVMQVSGQLACPHAALVAVQHAGPPAVPPAGVPFNGVVVSVKL